MEYSATQLQALESLAETQGWDLSVVVRHQEPLQSWLARASSSTSFDLVLLHAVLEWTPDPRGLLAQVKSIVAPGGYLSVTFYNLDGYVYRRLLQGNFNYLELERPRSQQKDLTPIYPLQLEEVKSWMQPDRNPEGHAKAGFELLRYRGLRCFSDYMHPRAQKRSYDELLEQERIYSLRSPFRDVARYIHLLYQRRI